MKKTEYGRIKNTHQADVHHFTGENIKELVQFYINKMFSRNALLPTRLMWVHTHTRGRRENLYHKLLVVSSRDVQSLAPTSTWDLGDFYKEVTAGACLEV